VTFLLCDVSIAVVWTEPGRMNTRVGALLKTFSRKVLVRQLNYGFLRFTVSRTLMLRVKDSIRCCKGTRTQMQVFSVRLE